MKILFICGCMEPGRDGVGDYSRRLAGECIRQGHQAQIVAINDRSLTKTNHEACLSKTTQDDYGTHVEVWRWPDAVNWHKKKDMLIDLLNDEKPDIVSIQFVAYSFHPKGLAWPFVSMIKDIAAAVDVRWQIMFHELWITRHHSPLGGIIGFLQQQLISRLIRILPSTCVFHSHVTGFVETLRSNKVDVRQLPLFGNIPVFENQDIRPTLPVITQDAYIILYFGSFTPQIDLLDLKLRELAGKAKSDCHFVSIGSAGPYEEMAQRTVENIIGKENAHFIGILPAEQISAWMLRAQVGLSRSSLAFYEKSGSTAAMLEHGLEVHFLTNERPREYKQTLPKFPPANIPTLRNTTELFISTLRSTS